MPYCTHCRRQLPYYLERLGARCPRCRQPIEEAVRDPHQPGPHSAGSCPLHDSNPALGTCSRCGTFVCGVCRTRWAGQVLCIACIERALEETPPVEARAHRQQAILAVLLGLAAWLVAAGAMAIIIVGSRRGVRGNEAFIGLGVLVLFASPLPAALGLGQATAAIRIRGEHMILATIGLILSGLEAGAVLGMMASLAIWIVSN